MRMIIGRWLQYLAPKREFAGQSFCWIPIKGFTYMYLLYKRAALCGAVYGASATERLFVKGGEFVPGFGFLSHCDMTLAVERDVKTYSFFPSIP